MGELTNTSIQTYLTTNKEEEQNQSIDAVASAVETSLSGNSDDSAAEDKLWELWRTVVASAKATNSEDSLRKQRIVQFVLALQARQPPSSAKLNQASIQNMALWRDLPIFGYALRDSWNVTITDSSTEQDCSAWINLNAWLALFEQQAYQSKSAQLDQSLLGLWTIRTALEDEVDNPPDAAVAAAAVWLRDASTAIWGLSRSEKTFEGKMAKPGPRFSDEQWRGFNVTRWQGWNQRLRDLQSKTSDESTVVIVRQAIEAMEKAGAQ